MELISLKLQNFKKYKNREFEFKNGFTGIVGKNGSGKSTIFEAIRFALFGSTQTKKELLKNSLTPKENLKVELEFVFESKDYVIVREYRGASNKATASIKENDELKASDVRSVNQFIKELIKMDEKAFLSTVFSSQKELMKLSLINSDERKSMIRKLLGFDKIDKIQKEIKEKIKETKIKIDSFNSNLMSEEVEQQKLESIKKMKEEILTLQNELEKEKKEEEIIKSKIDEIEKNQKIMEQNRDKKQKLDNQKNIIKNDISHNEKLLKEKENLLQEIAKKEEIYQKDSHYKNEYESLKLELDELNRIKGKAQNRKIFENKDKELREEYSKLLEKKEKLKSELIDKKELESQKLVTENQISVLGNFQKNMLQKEQELIQKIAENQAKSDELLGKLNKIKRLGKEAICPTCNRPLEKEYDDVVNSFQKDINQINNEKLDALNYTLYKIKEKLKKLEESLYLENKILKELQENESKYKDQLREIDSLEEKRKFLLKDIEENGLLLKDNLNVEFNEKEYEEKKALFEKLKQKRDELLKLETEISKKEKIQKECEKLENELKEFKNSLTKLENEKIEFNEEEYQKTKEDIKSLRIDKENRQKNIYEIEKEKLNRNSAIEKINEEIEENQKQKDKIVKLQNDFTDYEKLDVFTKSFKNRLNSKVAPMITQKATYLFSKITDGKYAKLEIDDNFDIYIYDNGDKFLIDRFSGGEIDLANLVLRIAISQTIMELNSATQISFLAFDEIFGSQDEARREMILKAFYEIKEQFREIFVISHESDVKEGFENVIEL